MTQELPFQINSRFLEESIKSLKKETGYGREELIRGLTYMIGRRCGQTIQKLAEKKEPALLKELEIAILHSSEEK
ncbi:MAG: hypothetical protein ACLFN5_02415 [bacterium]